MPVSLPAVFIDNINAYFPDDAAGLISCIENGEPYRAIRANTLKISAQSLGGLLSLTERVPWCADGYYTNHSLSKSVYYRAGLFYIQEPSAMSAAAALDVQPGDKVLDICAAPGGKTAQIAAALNGSGFVFSNDISASRCRGLIKNIEMLGITNSVVISEKPHRLAQRFPLFFDKILIDAPCSGEGMFRRDTDAVKNYTKHKSEDLSRIQQEILQNAAVMLKPGGEMVYSTCTFSPIENEMVIGDFLDKHPGFGLLPINENPGFTPGDPCFYENGKYQDIKYTARIFPHKAKGEGFFLARLVKKDNLLTGSAGVPPVSRQDSGVHLYQFFTGSAGVPPASGYQSKKIPDKNSRINPGAFYSFADKCLSADYLPRMLNSSRFIQCSDSLYLIPDNLPDLTGLRVLRHGLRLGEIKKDRFAPSQALAMSLTKSDIKNAIYYNDTDEDLIRYLKGEDLPVPSGENGYCIILAAGYPVGFGKITNGKLKNKYPSSWALM